MTAFFNHITQKIWFGCGQGEFFLLPEGFTRPSTLFDVHEMSDFIGPHQCCETTKVIVEPRAAAAQVNAKNTSGQFVA